MMQLHQEHKILAEKDTITAVICPDQPERFQNDWKEHKITFRGLVDEQHFVFKLYGREARLFKYGRMPSQMIIDKHGMLRFVHYGHSIEDIPVNEEIFALLDVLQSEG